MTPKLPSNPMTITPMKHARHFTADDVYRKYHGRLLNIELFAEVRQDLQDIRDMDNYERNTNQIREDAKRALRRILDQEL